MWTQYFGFKVTTKLQAELSRRIGDDQKEWVMGLGEDSELESEFQRSELIDCFTAHQHRKALEPRNVAKYDMIKIRR